MFCYLLWLWWTKSAQPNSPVRGRTSPREEEEGMGLHILVTLVCWVGSAILLKNTDRLCWDVITAGEWRRCYTLQYAFKKLFSNLGFCSFWFFKHFWSLPSLKLQTVSSMICKGAGGGNKKEMCANAVLQKVCNSTVMKSFCWMQNTVCLAFKPFFFAFSYPKKYLHEMSVTLWNYMRINYLWRMIWPY